MTVFACVPCMDARAKTAASSRCSKAVYEEKKQKSKKAENDGGRESRREATGRPERRDGRLWPASHSSCVSTPHTHKTYIHIQDESSTLDACYSAYTHTVSRLTVPTTSFKLNKLIQGINSFKELRHVLTITETPTVIHHCFIVKLQLWGAITGK